MENGADAVYFGLATEVNFNARARAKNIPLDELPDLIEWLHRRGVKGYVTVNTLVFTDELPRVEATLRRIAESGADAVLVQDVGVARLARALCPDLPLHASTQMTLTSAENIRMIESLGAERVILARELSIDEIRKIRRETEIELEAFVHGALCVAYSGQCLTSESLGGRSANRGECAQACRMPYQLVCDGQDVELGDQKYLLSPQDLAAFDLVPALIDAGVSSLKIEGRLKTPEYVAHVTQHYRRAIDAAVAGRAAEFTREEVQQLAVSFSRGFSHGWLDGHDHKALVPGRSSAKRGIRLGEVTRVGRGRVRVRLACSVRRGDGVVFEGNRLEGAEQGGRVYEVFVGGRSVKHAVSEGEVELSFAHGAIRWDDVCLGQMLWKTDDPQLDRRLRKTFAGPAPQRAVPLDITVEAAVGQPLIVLAQADSGAACRIESDEVLAEARKHPLSADVLREQLGRLGGSGYELRRLDAKIDGQPMVPLSVLGKLRHAMIEKLDASAATPPVRRIAAEPVVGGILRVPRPESTSNDAAQLHVLCRSLLQLQAVLASDVKSVIVDFHDIREYREAVSIAHQSGAKILLATPRIQKPGEIGIFRALARHAPDGVLARNLAAIGFFREQGLPMVADFSLNATNELTADWLISQGVTRVTPSYDMNRDQLLDMVRVAAPHWLEVVVHQHMPMFHMEHCVFCSVLSPGTDKTNCGRPCDRHLVRLRDHVGAEHPLRADVGCRNTLFNAVPQSAAEVVPLLVQEGIRHFRIELLDDADADPRSIVDLYRDLLAGKVTGREVWSRLRAANRVGVTRGTLEERRNPLAIL